MSKLRLVLLWHMHQPFYTDPWSGVISMPWVRLHASKSYNDMAVAIERRPVKVVVNFSPSLLLQLHRLAGGATDIFFDIAAKPTDALSEQDRAFILDNFFAANSETMIKPHARYLALWEKRRSEGWHPGVECHDDYTTNELRDLIVWFHLAWTGWAAREEYKEIEEIEKRGWDFSEADKETVLNVGLDIVQNLFGRWKALSQSGKVELTTTPFAHPILPLLIDTETARRCMPGTKLPEPFRFPEDAREHVLLAREVYREVFGIYPNGMWPSEGSVSPEIIPILKEAGFQWLATDEGILQRTFGIEHLNRRHFHPYLATYRGAEVSVFFRDRNLSDLVGFDYSKLPEKDAATDMLNRLHNSASATAAWEDPAVVTIALDGENPWEHYKQGGEEFLDTLYSGLAEAADIETVLPAEWLRDHPPRNTIDNLYSGSWIRSDYSIWIGNQEENDAWNALLATRRDYEDMIDTFPDMPDIENTGLLGFFAGLPAYIGPSMARSELFAAEGSDWFWWFGDDFTSDNDEEFDRVFRSHLTNVYRFLGHAPPEKLAEPILQPHPVRPDYEPVGFLHPTIDGKVTEYYEWNDGGMYTVRAVGGTMYTREIYLERIYYGFDAHRWFLRLDRREKAWKVEEGAAGDDSPLPDCVIIEGLVGEEKSFRIEVPAHPAPVLPCRLYLPDREHPELISPLAKAAAYSCMEMLIPFRVLDLEPGMELKFAILLERFGRELDRYPSAGFLRFEVPDADFERRMWSA